MTLTQLQHFIAVCRFTSVTRAAQMLHVTQPTLSTSIRNLEQEFSVNLFHRVNKQLVLTQEGELFRRKSQLILAQAEALCLEMKDLGANRNHLRIGVPPMIGATLFPPLYHAFHQLYPEILLEVTEVGSVATQELVKNEELDLALIIFDPATQHQFETLCLRETRYVYCVGPDHKLAGQKKVTMAQVLAEPLILFQPGSVQNSIIQSRFVQENCVPNVLMYSSNLYNICEYIKDYQGGAFLFEEIPDTNPLLVKLETEEPWPVRIGLIWKQDKSLYSDVAKFISFCKKQAPDSHS